MPKAMYAFSGDPITFGHIDIIKRATSVFDEVIVGIGVNPDKKYMFSLEERRLMAQQSLSNIDNVNVVSFSGLLVDYAYENGITVIIKGVRNPEDFNYENILHQVGESQKLKIDTHILFAKPTLAHISSGAVKAIQKNHGSIHEYVPLVVKQKLEERISDQYIVGVTGEIGCGKSYIGNMLKSISSDLAVHNIELDHIAHQILGERKETSYKNICKEIASKFGTGLINSEGFIDRKALGEIVFNDVDKLRVLNEMLYIPINVRLRRELDGKKGLVLINAALLAEADMLHVCNNNALLIKVDEKTQTKRLMQRDLRPEQIRKRIACQYNWEEKKKQISNKISRDGYGHLWMIDNSSDVDSESIQQILCQLKKYFGIE